MKEHLLIFWQRKLEDAYRENYALQAENARLKAEVERLEKEVWRMKVFKGIDEDTTATLKDALNTVPEWAKVLETEAENARLKAEVERLTSDLQMEKENEDRLVRLHQDARNEVERLKRAGDLMLKYACANVTYPCYATMAKDWNAAKGVQS